MTRSLPKSPLSLWLAEYGPYAPSPPLEGDATVDVAIVGGGFTGIATAHTLLKEQPGMRVAVLEHEYVGYGASGRNGSFAMTVAAWAWGRRPCSRASDSSVTRTPTWSAPSTDWNPRSATTSFNATIPVRGFCAWPPRPAT